MGKNLGLRRWELMLNLEIGIGIEGRDWVVEM